MACFRKLRSITVDAGNPYLSSDSDGVLYNKDKSRLLCYPAGRQGTEYIVPASVTEIGNGAFFYCDSLNRIRLPEGLTAIGADAFSFCFALTEIGLPQSLSSVGEKAFQYCYELKDVYYGGSEEDWEKITVSADNEYLNAARKHFSSALTFIQKDSVKTLLGEDTVQVSLTVFGKAGQSYSLMGVGYSDQQRMTGCSARSLILEDGVADITLTLPGNTDLSQLRLFFVDENLVPLNEPIDCLTVQKKGILR